MSYVPVNPSDLIPISGAYTHRITLPAIVGYEGVGRVIDAPTEAAHLLGRRVLPLRGEGTWQSHVDCPLNGAVEVPEGIADLIAARAYINPLAATTMLRLWSVKDKTVLLTAAGSTCAEHLTFWATRKGAAHIIGVYRSDTRLTQLRRAGIKPVSISDSAALLDAAAQADITFDALGGEIAGRLLRRMRQNTDFISYGLLTGVPVAVADGRKARHHRFHLRDHLPPVIGPHMQDAFCDIWHMLAESPPPTPKVFAARNWRAALADTHRPGGQKPILDMSNLTDPA